MKDEEPWIERRIITGLIVSTEFIQGIYRIWDSKLLTSPTVRTLANWCMEFYKKYKRAPNRDIEGIYTKRLQKGLGKDQAEWIEMVLQSLSDEYDRGTFNVSYLLDETKEYLSKQHFKQFQESLSEQFETASAEEAERLLSTYHPLITGNVRASDFMERPSRVREAFETQRKSLIHFGFALGRMWNEQMTREGFVALMGHEKIGKTFWLTELAMRSLEESCNVAFFGAGDMSENQMIKRIAIWMAQKSDRARYCEELFVPTIDCWNNQSGQCPKRRGDSDAPFYSKDQKQLKVDEILEACRRNPGHRPCHDCNNRPRLGAVWLKIKPEVEPLNSREAWNLIRKWKAKHKKRFKLICFPNETLSCHEINTILNNWEREEGFIPDVVIVDYADILAPDADCKNLDFRNQQNKIWQRLRRLSQEKRCLVLTATQASARSYDKNRSLKMSDFSEDKRKYAHVTAMYGLNQTADEKKIGLLRVNEIVVREGDFDRTFEVTVLQRLQIGRPFLGSF